MSYRCVKEAFGGKALIPVGTVIERVGHDSIWGETCVTFSIDGIHYAMRNDAFDEYFEEAGE